MGLLQKAVETYDAHAAQVGEVQVGHEVLAPVSHILTSAQIEITVNAAGELADARAVDKKESKIIIPVTEDSGGRTSAPARIPCATSCVIWPPMTKSATRCISSSWSAGRLRRTVIPCCSQS